MLDKAALRTVALAHQVCPYHLGQALVRWADVVVGDYNHYFDLHALLYGLVLADGWRAGLLVDEAHNLVARARSMYTAELRQSTLQTLWPLLPAALKPSLARLNRQWGLWRDAQAALPGGVYTVHDELPAPLLGALQAFASAASEHLQDPPERQSPLLDFYFDVLHFLRLNDSLSAHSLIDLRCEAGAERLDDAAAESVLCLRNVVPAPFLKPRFAAAHATTLFSATLQPTDYYRDLLGLPDASVVLDVASPFQPDQLQVKVAGDVSTRWAERSRSVSPIAALIATQYRAAPGNYLAFFSSFDYMAQVANRLAIDQPGLPQWQQSPQMGEAARDAFLARFEAEGRGIGFAVLGGAFAEGIDLPGRRLIGAFVATLGLPQWNDVNEQLKRRMDASFGDRRGHDYTYLYPGLQKVVQAAGRVIRTPEDRGVVWLIDDRYGRAKVRRLLPSWWRIERAESGLGPPLGPQ